MDARLTPPRRRSPRRVPLRRLQRGMAARGLAVVTALVAAVALQLGGSRLQCRLADLVGAPGTAPAPVPAAMPSCGTPHGNAAPMRPCKVATMAAADGAAAPKF